LALEANPKQTFFNSGWSLVKLNTKSIGKPHGTEHSVFDEPVMTANHVDDGRVFVKIGCAKVFNPSTRVVKISNAGDIACWFIDSNYNDESFFVNKAYLSSTALDPYNGL